MSRDIDYSWFNKPKSRQKISIRKGDVEIVAYEKEDGDLSICVYGIEPEELRRNRFDAIVIHITSLIDLTNELIKE